MKIQSLTKNKAQKHTFLSFIFVSLKFKNKYSLQIQIVQ